MQKTTVLGVLLAAFAIALKVAAVASVAAIIVSAVFGLTNGLLEIFLAGAAFFVGAGLLAFVLASIFGLVTMNRILKPPTFMYDQFGHNEKAEKN